MSEYQYHEWQTVDRVLTPEVKYFDAYLYFANWGSLRLMFRFPEGLLDKADIEPYYVDEYITFETVDQYQVLDLDFDPEDGGGWMETGASLSPFIRLRADLIEGDFRLLYLAWLKAVTFYGVPDEDEYEEDDPDSSKRSGAYDHEPPVPPGLKKLSPALQNFVRVFDIDPFLVQAASKASPDDKKVLTVDYHDLVARFPRSECDDFLTRLAEGDPAVGFALRKRLGAFLPQERPHSAQPRTIQQLRTCAVQLEKDEVSRQAEAARRKHITEMKALAAREAQTWQQVDFTLENGPKVASVYDEATALLDKLKQLSEFQDTRDVFLARLRQLAQKYASRPSLIRRWKERG